MSDDAYNAAMQQAARALAPVGTWLDGLDPAAYPEIRSAFAEVRSAHRTAHIAFATMCAQAERIADREDFAEIIHANYGKGGDSE